jgi:hypothetical protein
MSVKRASPATAVELWTPCEQDRTHGFYNAATRFRRKVWSYKSRG